MTKKLSEIITEAKEAYELGRGCIGTEIVEDYAVVASRRLSMAMKQQRLSFA